MSSHMKQPSSQKGLSLIGLLIGLLISVLCILASLGLYKNLIQVATVTKLDANHDGNIAAALLTMQMEVQSAGYGIDNARNGTHIATHYDSANKKRYLLWRFSTATGVYQCRGLLEQQRTVSDETFQELVIVTPASGCTATAVLSSLTWSNEVATLGRWRVYDDGDALTGLDKRIADHGTLFGYTLNTQATCSPYGASTTTDNRTQLVVTAPGSAFLQGVASVPSTYQFCLANIYP